MPLSRTQENAERLKEILNRMPPIVSPLLRRFPFHVAKVNELVGLL